MPCYCFPAFGGRCGRRCIMRRNVDPGDYRALKEVQRVLGEVFNSVGTDWFPAEQQGLHGAIADVGRVVDSLGGEGAVKAIARRLHSRTAASRAAAGILDKLRRKKPSPADRERVLRRLREPQAPRLTPAQMADYDRRFPHIPESIRYVTDWDEVERRSKADEEHPDVPVDIRHITDWGEVKRRLSEGKGGEAA